MTIAILGVVLLNAVIGFLQEYRAEKATEALQKLVPANAKVVREGEITIVAAADLVPGDVIVLEEGDNISADARLMRQYEMSTINIALTGESDAVRKTADPIVEEQLANINMPNLVFMGTSVAAGTGSRGRLRHRPEHRVRPHLLAHRRRLGGEVAAAARNRHHGAHGFRDRPRVRRSALRSGAGGLPLRQRGSAPVCARRHGRPGPGGPAGHAVGSPGRRRAAHGQGQRAHQEAGRGRDAGLRQRDLHRQDRHAHQGRDDGQGDLRRRRGHTTSAAPATSRPATSPSATRRSPRTRPGAASSRCCAP